MDNIYILSKSRYDSTNHIKFISLFYEHIQKSSNYKIKHLDTNFTSILTTLTIDDSFVNIYLIDVELDNDSTGFEIAQRIRNIDIDGYLLFFTKHLELTFHLFDYNLKAMTLFDKNDPHLQTKLYHSFEQIQEEKNIRLKQSRFSPKSSKEPSLVYKHLNNTIRIPYKDIIVIETTQTRRILNITTLYTTYECPLTMNKLQELSKGFLYRCHRSYIINLDHVLEISSQNRHFEVLLRENNRCDIGKKYVESISNAFSGRFEFSL